jgi:hypothetical protein
MSRMTFFVHSSGALMAALLATAVAQSASALTYDVDYAIGAGSVVGTVETDGNTGTLVASDITAWDLTLNGIGASYTITSGDSDAALFLGGSDVTATKTDLYFNFSGTDVGYLGFQDGAFSGNHYWCNNTSWFACFSGATVTPGSIFDGTAVNVAESGNQIIATASVSEPAAWALMLLGVGGMGASLRARRRSAPATA